jgi:hypothetical protein
VCTELRYFLAKETERVVFLDRFFNYNSERAYRIFEYIINNDNGITSSEFNINGDDLDEETLRLLTEAREGQIIFNMDIASTNAEVLAACGRGENIYRLMYNTTKMLQSGRVRTEIHVKAGLPLENEAMFARSFNKAYGLAEGMPVHIDSICISKGTAIRAGAHDYGYIYAAEPPYEVISTGSMSADDILRIKGIARTVERYIGDGGFSGSIPRVLNDTGLKPYDIFGRLTGYISKNGLTGKTRKKEHLARILYAYTEGLYEDLRHGRRAPGILSLRKSRNRGGACSDRSTVERFKSGAGSRTGGAAGSGARGGRTEHRSRRAPVDQRGTDRTGICRRLRRRELHFVPRTGQSGRADAGAGNPDPQMR